mgnify:CR=1 FL=1
MSCSAARIQVLHVLGPKNLVPGIERSVASEQRCRLPARWRYVAQMERAYAAADLMLARSGASTVLETAARRAAGRIRAPTRTETASRLCDAGLVVERRWRNSCWPTRDCTPTWVATRRSRCSSHHPDRLAGMSQALAMRCRAWTAR